MKNFKFIIGVLFVLLTFTACVDDADLLPIDPNDTKPILVTVPNGSTTSKIGEILAEKGLVKSSEVFSVAAKELNLDDSMKAGKYSLNKAMSAKKMAKIIADGKVFKDAITVLIPEGYEFRMIADRLEKKLGIDKKKFIDLAQNHKFNYKFLQDVPKGVKYRLEGFLFPATYEFKKGASELEILKTMLDKFNSVYNEDCYKRQKELGLTTNQLITMASIIEREAAASDERNIIAGVFYNRIRSKMPFQSCATVQYVLEERKPVLSNEDTLIDSPYNTYKNAGFPLGPIASPGEQSIKAALYPEKHDYLFFVVSGNNDGKHTFSKTLKEHNAASEKAFKKLKENGNN